MIARAAAPDPEPRPVPAPQVHDPEAVALLRRLDCRRYGRCLSLAVARDWDGFACFGCRAYDPAPDAERARDAAAARPGSWDDPPLRRFAVRESEE